MITHDDIIDILREVPDPELPVNIVDLGLVEHVEVADDHVEVVLLPTFVGCPALDMIRDDVVTRLGERVDCALDVQWTYDPAWTVDRITDAGRAALKEHGVTVPEHSPDDGTVTLTTSMIPCPFCDSRSTRLDSPFGPTRCRMIYYCEACKNTFEHMKRL